MGYVKGKTTIREILAKAGVLPSRERETVRVGRHFKRQTVTSWSDGLLHGRTADAYRVTEVSVMMVMELMEFPHTTAR